MDRQCIRAYRRRFLQIGEHFKGDKIATGDRGIYVKNEAGYVARMTVVYYGLTESGTAAAPTAIKVLATDKVTAGTTRPLTIPALSSIDASKPIVVSIEGFGTTNDKVFSTVETSDGLEWVPESTPRTCFTCARRILSRALAAPAGE